MLYHYLASDDKEKVIEGELEAARLEELLQYLAGQSLKPIAVKAINDPKAFTLRRLFGNINLHDKIFLMKYLSLMLRVGTDLLAAINILISDFDKPAVRNFLLEVRENLTRGRPFYEVFGRHPKVFSSVFVNLIKAAEASGTLQQTFDDLSLSLTREAELRGKIRSALIYPILLLILSASIFVGVLVFAIPRIADVFKDSGIEPPLFSRIVFGLGEFVSANIVTLFISTTVIVIGSIWFFWKTDIGHRLWSRFIHRLPVVKKVFQDLAVQRFASTFSSLTKAGVPIIQALKITADTVGNEEMSKSLLRIADEGLAKGLTIGDAFRREPVLPRVVTNLVAISDRAGHLEEMLATLADFYRANVESSLKTLVSIVEPVLLLMMGLVIGVVAMSIIVPVYQLSAGVGV
ncbi:MAG: type II secretion system F family protein [Anaplasmataceae bacterium]|nr:type II secretion system F family protein [Anaplasmataceae bacterium]